MDNRDTWCVGKVLSIDTKGMMTIRFDGWGDKYKEVRKIWIISRNCIKKSDKKDILKMGVGNVNPYGDENFRFKRYFTPQQGDQNK